MSWYGDFIDSSNAKNAARWEIRRQWWGKKKEKKKMAEKTSREILLEEALKAAENVISYYECEHDRSNYDDEDLPEELLEAEEEFNKAKEKLK